MKKCEAMKAHNSSKSEVLGIIFIRNMKALVFDKSKLIGKPRGFELADVPEPVLDGAPPAGDGGPSDRLCRKKSIMRGVRERQGIWNLRLSGPRF